MSTDLEIIKELEEEIGIELKELEGKVEDNTKAYKTDDNQNVIGLYVRNAGLKNSQDDFAIEKLILFGVGG